MFNSFVLLSPDTVALPIIPSNSIEICNFAEELAAPPPLSPVTKSSDTECPQPDVPLLKTTCTLELPPLQHGALVLRMTCRCEPNPLGPTTSAANVDTLTPFYSDPTRAIMILHLHVRLPLTTTRVYTMLVHRASLLEVARDAIEARARARTNAESRPSPTTSASGQVSPSLPFVAAFQPNIHAPNFNPVLAPFSHGDVDDDDQDDDDDDEVAEEPPSVPWAEWGPQHTRWFQDEFPGTRWITTTCGQRYVTVEEDPIEDDARSSTIVVYDFNPHTVRRLAAAHRKKRRRLRGYWDVTLPEGELAVGSGGDGVGTFARLEGGVLIPFTDPRTRVIGQIQCEPTELMAGYVMEYRIFDEAVRTCLPYAQLSSFETFGYGAVLLDRDMIIGVKVRCIRISA